jgi:hypothetical protein
MVPDNDVHIYQISSVSVVLRASFPVPRRWEFESFDHGSFLYFFSHLNILIFLENFPSIL